LKRRLAIPICLLAVVPEKEAMRAVKLVQIFAPKIIANPASKPIIPLLSAANVITPTAPLDCTIAVTIIPIIQNIHRLISLYCSKLNSCDITSTFSLRKSIHRKNNPNPMRIFAQYHRYFLSVTIIIIPPRAIRGRANMDILKSPNPKYPTIRPVAVDQIFAPTNTPKALMSFIIPALTNPSVRSETRVLLFKIPVITVPTSVAFRQVSVYFWRIMLSFGPHSFFKATSNISIPKRIRPKPANNTHRFINN